MNLRLRYLAVIVTVVLALLLSNNATAVQTGWYVRVDAGQWDRHNTVVSFRHDFKGSSAHLKDEKGAAIPLQFDGTTASFVLGDLKAGDSKTFLIVSDSGKLVRDTGGVELSRVQNRLEIKIRGKQVFSF